MSIRDVAAHLFQRIAVAIAWQVTFSIASFYHVHEHVRAIHKTTRSLTISGIRYEYPERMLLLSSVRSNVPFTPVVVRLEHQQEQEHQQEHQQEREHQLYGQGQWHEQCALIGLENETVSKDEQWMSCLSVTREKPSICLVDRSRRRLLEWSVALAFSGCSSADAAALPITVQEAESGWENSIGSNGRNGGFLTGGGRQMLARVSLLRRPKPVQLLRPRLDMGFAVVLMRSSYAVTDELDFIAMDQFQRDFFLIRAAEYERYIQQLGGSGVVARQGDLTDPYYFDFISYAQYAAINRALLSNPASVFREQQPLSDRDETDGADEALQQKQRFESVLVRRDPYMTNNLLAPEHDQRVGALVLRHLDETFQGNPATALPLPATHRPSLEQVQAALDQLIKLFLINGYSWSGAVAAVAGAEKKPSSSPASSRNANKKLPVSTQFCLSMTSPATFWSGQMLDFQNCPIRNDFLLKAAKALVHRLGYTVVTSSVQYDRSIFQELNYITII